MKKILAFLGSPRRNGASAAVLEQVIAGARAEGAEIITYYMNDETIKGCQGCRYCKTHDGCGLNDPLAPMYAQLKEAEGVVIASPIYFMGITSQTKKLIDRLYPVRAADGSSTCPGKKFVTVYTQCNPNPEMFRDAIDTNDRVLKSFRWEMIDSIVYSGTANPDEAVAEDVMRRAFEAGRNLVKRSQRK